MKVKSLSRVQLLATPWTAAYQAPQSMGFFSQEYWSELPFPSPRDLPHPGIESESPELQADSLPLSHYGLSTKECRIYILLETKIGEGNGTPLQYSCLENPWTEEPGKLQSMGSLRVRND